MNKGISRKVGRQKDKIFMLAEFRLLLPKLVF